MRPCLTLLSVSSLLSLSVAAAPPSLDGADWHVHPEPVLTLEATSGHTIRIAPKQVLPRAEGGYMLLYQSMPPEFWSSYPSRSTTAWDGKTVSQTTSLAFSPDLMTWEDGPDNPIFATVAHPWQGTRAMGEWLHRDVENDRWILFFSANGMDHIPGGIRAVGVAFSSDLRNWQVHERPVVTPVDVAGWAPGRGDRVYMRGLARVDGRWVMFVSAGQSGSYAAGFLTADVVRGPWTSHASNPFFVTGGLQAPILHDGTWYATVSRRGSLNLIHSDRLDATWSLTPLIDIAPQAVRHLVPTPAPDGWRVFGESRNVSRHGGQLGVYLNIQAPR